MSTELPLSFDHLYQDYSLRVYRWAYRLLRHQQAAEDATQETFLRAWRYLANFDPEKGALSSWLYRITVQVIRNQQSHSQWHDAPVSLDHVTLGRAGPGGGRSPDSLPGKRGTGRCGPWSLATERATRTALAGKWLPRGGNWKSRWQDIAYRAQLARERAGAA